MPKGSSEISLKAIQDAVRHAAKYAEEHGGVIVQDTAWEGYATMANESYEQLRLEDCVRPTHIFLQAGVGSMAGSVLGYYANVFKESCPKVIIVEPEKANCI